MTKNKEELWLIKNFITDETYGRKFHEYFQKTGYELPVIKSDIEKAYKEYIYIREKYLDAIKETIQ